jgi:phosphoribosylanthranilate isomerase
MGTWVKICGITRADDARAAFDAGADAIGINFWPGSRRCCSVDAARAIVDATGPDALVFGVFVEGSREQILSVVREAGLSGVQLHGGQGAGDACDWGLPTILAVAATSRAAVERAVRERSEATRREADAYRLLVDHGSGGGSGLAVDESLLAGLDLADAVLAGGLTPGNVAARVARLRPFGVDVAGGVESAPGVKDHRAIAEFVRVARSADVA